MTHVTGRVWDYRSTGVTKKSTKRFFPIYFFKNVTGDGLAKRDIVSYHPTLCVGKSCNGWQKYVLPCTEVFKGIFLCALKSELESSLFLLKNALPAKTVSGMKREMANFNTSCSFKITFWNSAIDCVIKTVLQVHFQYRFVPSNTSSLFSEHTAFSTNNGAWVTQYLPIVHESLRFHVPMQDGHQILCRHAVACFIEKSRHEFVRASVEKSVHQHHLNMYFQSE